MLRDAPDFDTVVRMRRDYAQGAFWGGRNMTGVTFDFGRFGVFNQEDRGRLAEVVANRLAACRNRQVLRVAARGRERRPHIQFVRVPCAQ